MNGEVRRPDSELNGASCGATRGLRSQTGCAEESLGRRGPNGIRAVFLDVGQTLLQVRSSVGEVYAETAARHGVPVASADLARRFRRAWARSTERSRARGFRCSDEILRGEWLEIVRDTFPEDVPPRTLETIFEELYDRFSSAEAWRLVPGAAEVIAAIRTQGIRVGILSNWDSRLPRMLEEMGMAAALDFSVISYRVGFEKPHPAIFMEALRVAGVAPGEALHVGDSWEADIEPARALGLRSLWIAPGSAGDEIEATLALGTSLERAQAERVAVERVDALPTSLAEWARILGGSYAAP